MEKSPSNGEISLSVNTKAGILTQQMYRSQPKINDYRGAPGFSPEMLRQDRAALDENHVISNVNPPSKHPKM